MGLNVIKPDITAKDLEGLSVQGHSFLHPDSNFLGQSDWTLTIPETFRLKTQIAFVTFHNGERGVIIAQPLTSHVGEYEAEEGRARIAFRDMEIAEEIEFVFEQLVEREICDWVELEE
jgi:hypothetical protein